MKFKVVKIQALIQPLISNDFESKLIELKLGINSQLINVLTPFLAFFGSYINTKAHNMLVIILDPCFKNMKFIQNYMGNIIVADVVVEYDVKVVHPLLLYV